MSVTSVLGLTFGIGVIAGWLQIGTLRESVRTGAVFVAALVVSLLVGVVVIVGALTYFPALSLGPIVEHLML